MRSSSHSCDCQLTTNNDSFHWRLLFPGKLHSNSETFTTIFEGKKKNRFRSRGKTTSLHFNLSVSAPVQDMREHLPHSIRVYSLQLHNVTLSNRFYKVSWLTRARYIRVRDLLLYNAECFEWTQGLWMRHRCSLSSTPCVMMALPP